MPSPTLGNFDMVMAISQDTINSNFLNSNINQNINFIVSQKVSPKGIPSYSIQSPINQEKLNSWKNKNDNSFYYALEGMVNEPIISIEENTPKSMYLTIEFQSGKFYFQKIRSKSVTATCMSNIKYTVNVDLSLITIDNTDDISSPSAKRAINEIINNSGLPASDFETIGLFLDFTKLSNESYAPSKSTVPESAVEVLNLAMQQYFSKLFRPGNSNLPLGYSTVQKNNTTNAIFQPTAAGFSTSYSSKGAEYSALNFLFMTNGNPIPSANNKGILPKSLIEITGTGSDESGTFGIDYQQVVNSIISPLRESVNSQLSSAFDQFKVAIKDAKIIDNKTETTLSSNFSSSDILKDGTSGKIKLIKFLIGRNLSINSTLVQGSVGDNGVQGLILTFEYTYEISITTHAPIFGSQIATLSTQGKFQKGPNNNFGQPGKLVIYILPGSHGFLNISIQEKQGQNMQLGYQEISSKSSKIFKKIEEEINPTHLFGGAFTASANQISNGVAKAIKDLNSVINNFNNQKVVLPFSSDYKYKNFFLNTDNGDVLLSEINFTQDGQ